MKIDLIEIWEFMDLAPEPKTAAKGDQWIYELVAGGVGIKNLTSNDIKDLKKEDNYDTELLPSIFTFREILWQPNVYTQPALCIPQLNILKVFCEEWVDDIKKSQNGSAWPYFNLLLGLGEFCQQAIKKITSVEKQKDIRISSILGDFRKQAFPIIKFFIFHPMNRKDYQIDALNRLNYAVKIMLTQYNNKYFELLDPYWNVTIGNPDTLQKTSVDEQQIPSKASKRKQASTESLKVKDNAKSKIGTVSLGEIDHKLEEL